MPKWKKDATEFTVSVGYHEVRGYQVYVPRPVVEALEIHTDKTRDPKPITFVIKGKIVEIRGGHVNNDEWEQRVKKKISRKQ